MPNPRLRKLQITVLKDSVGFQIPASGVDVTPYKRGGISDRAETLTVGAGRTLHLRDSSMFQVGDVLRIGASTTSTATVTAIAGGASLTVTISGGSYVTATNSRHVIIGGRVPTIYTDPIGLTTTATLTTDTQGYAQCFVKERVCDVLIGMSTGGVTPTLREAETSGDDEIWINALNYDSIQDAIDDCPSVLGNRCGTIFVPSGTWAVPTTIEVDKSVRLIGDGIGSTVLLFDSGHNTDVFNVTASNVTIENLSISGSLSVASGTGRGIVVGTGTPLGSLTLRNIEIIDSPSWGICFEGGEGGNSYIAHSLLERVTVNRPQSNGAMYGGSDAFVISIDNCDLSPGSSGVGYSIHAKNPTDWDIRNTELAPGPNSKAVLMELAGTASPDDGPIGIRISNCDIETVGGSTAAPIHIKNGRDIGIHDNYIYAFDDGVHLEDCEGGVLLNNVYKDLTNHDVKLTDCTRVIIVGGSSMDDDEVARPFRLSEAGSTSGTCRIVNGVIVPPRYATGSLPTAGSTTVPEGSLAYDTTTHTLKFMNNASTWTNV